jgi:hypothetical protein
MKTNTIIILSSFITLFAPVGPLVTVALISIGFDLGFGIWRSIKSRRKAGSTAKIGDIITSQKMLATGIKCLIYAAAIFFFYLVEKYIAGDIISHFISIELLLTKAVALFFVFIEVKSMNESYKDVTGKDILKSFRDFITGLKSESDKWR